MVYGPDNDAPGPLGETTGGLPPCGVSGCVRTWNHAGNHRNVNSVEWERFAIPPGVAEAANLTLGKLMTLQETAAAMGKEPKSELAAMKQTASDFWMRTAGEDFEKCWAKAVQRSAVDLVAVGSMFGSGSEQTRILRGLAFYAAGKAARIAGRVAQGQDANPDDELDLRVYSFMMAYVRRFGGWPWPANDAISADKPES